MSGDRSRANHANIAKTHDADAVGKLKKAANGVLEQDGPDQENHRPADRGGNRPEIRRSAWMLQHKLVGNRRQHDAGHDR